MNNTQLPPLNLDEYDIRWVRQDWPCTWQNRACGIEFLLGLQAKNKKGENDMFFATTIELVVSNQISRSLFSLKDIKEGAERAWKSVRWFHPEMGRRVGFDENEKPWIENNLIDWKGDAQEWAEATIITEHSTRTATELRDSLINTPMVLDPERIDTSVVIYMIVPNKHFKDTLDIGTRFPIIFRSNYAFMDEWGMRFMIQKFFYHLGNEVCNTDPNPFRWGEWDWSHTMLELKPSFVGGRHSDVICSGPIYDADLAQHLADANRILTSWGLRIQENPNGKPMTLFHKWNRHESQRILTATKSRIGKKYTLTHLTHAAMLLALVKINPPPAGTDPKAYVPSTIMSGRKYLMPIWSGGIHHYLANCQCHGTVIYENIHEYVQADGKESKWKTRRLMKKAAKMAKQSYDKSLARLTLPVTSAMILEMLTRMIVSEDSGEGSPRKFTMPILSSDGIVERFPKYSYWAYENPRQVFLLEETSFYANNSTTIPLIRLSSWRDCQRLSCDFNSKYYPPEYIQNYLRLVAGYMEVFAAGVAVEWLDEIHWKYYE